MSNIKHKISGISIFQTEDYNLFEMLTGNRGLNQNKIKKIIKEVEAGNDMLRYYPIQVSVEGDKMKILDGQHRFFISKTLKRPVYYIVVTEERSMVDIAKVNSNVEKWKATDFINCYIHAGNKHYLVIQEYLEQFGFSVGVSLSLLHRGEPGKANGGIDALMTDFEEGKFEVKTLQQAQDFGTLAKQFIAFPNWRSRNLLIALNRIQKAGLIDMQDLVAAFNRHPHMLVEKANYKDYIVCLEGIMNQGKHKRIIIA